MADWNNPSTKLIICPLPPIKPLLARGTGGLLAKQVAANWASYDTAKAKFDACIKQKNDEIYNATHPNRSPDGGISPALHKFNLSNPVFALARGAYLGLVNVNTFGWASIWYLMSIDPDQSYFNRAKAIWFNVGGDIAVLKINVDKGRVKKAVFKPKGWKPFDGFANAQGATEAGITAAGSVIAALAGVVGSFVKARPNAVPQPTANETTLTDADIQKLKEAASVNTPSAISKFWTSIPMPAKVIGGIAIGSLLVVGVIKLIKR